MTAAKCYCGAPLLADTGACRYRCPPEANPRHLKAQAKRRKANDLVLAPVLKRWTCPPL
jgi:hypothetical protein